jgi:hypothetical protein
MVALDRVTQILHIDRTYQYRLRAVDRAGNVGEWAVANPFTVKRFQETTSLATYIGSWRRSFQSNASGGAVLRSSQAGAKVTFTFKGTNVAIVATMTPTSGSARIGGQLVSFRASSNRWRQVVYAHRLGPTPSLHTGTIEVVGNGRVDIDAFVVLR